MSAQGFIRKPGGVRRIAVGFENDLFKRVAKRAEANGLSFSEQAIDLIKCGLFDIEESELYEPEGDRTNGRC